MTAAGTGAAQTSPAVASSPGPLSITPSDGPSSVGPSLVAAWQQVLAAHHAAIYGYGQLGPFLSDPAQIARARTTEQAHRVSRDWLEAQLVQAGATPAVTQPRYSPSVTVDSPASAQTWALQLEVSCAACYRYVLTVSAKFPATSSQPTGAAAPSTSGSTEQNLTVPTAARVSALAGLSAANLASIGWRALLTPMAPTVAFPGQ